MTYPVDASLPDSPPRLAARLRAWRAVPDRAGRLHRAAMLAVGVALLAGLAWPIARVSLGALCVDVFLLGILACVGLSLSLTGLIAWSDMWDGLRCLFNPALPARPGQLRHLAKAASTAPWLPAFLAARTDAAGTIATGPAATLLAILDDLSAHATRQQEKDRDRQSMANLLHAAKAQAALAASPAAQPARPRHHA